MSKLQSPALKRRVGSRAVPTSRERRLNMAGSISTLEHLRGVQSSLRDAENRERSLHRGVKHPAKFNRRYATGTPTLTGFLLSAIV
jgi:hypothetical protein